MAQIDPFEIGDGCEDAASDFSAGDGREESFDGIEPRRRGRREMAGPSRMVGQPPQDIGMLVRSVVDVDSLGHAASVAYPAAPVNPTSASVH